MPAHGEPRRTSPFFLVLLLVAIGAFLYVASPFAKPVLVALTFAAVLDPAHRWLTARLRGRRSASAALLAVGVLVAIVGPLAYFATVALQQALAGVRWLREALASEGVAGLVERLPDWLRGAAERVAEDLPALLDRVKALATQTGSASALGGILSATGGVVVGLFVMVVALYFILEQGPRLLEWLDEITPLAPGQLTEILRSFHGAVVAVVVSAVATAGVQAVLATLGYLAAGIPNPVFFGLATFVSGLIPVVGPTLVTIPVCAIWYATGHPIAGGLLAVWSVAVVSGVDNFLKPMLMRRGLSVHVSLIFLALLGGLASFGPIGLIVGPLALAFFISALRIWQREYGGGRPAGGPIPAPESDAPADAPDAREPNTRGEGGP